MEIRAGWKQVERHLPGAMFDEVVDNAIDIGFTLSSRDVGHAVLTQDGSHMAARASKAPLEMTATETENGIRLRWRYDTLVVFDTGDLERIADQFVALLSQ